MHNDEENEDIPQASGLDAATRWLQTTSLSPQEKENLSKAADNSAAKLTIFQHMLAVRRGGRLARSQDWLDDIQERLMSEQLLSERANDPYFLLQLGRFLLDTQEADTKFIQSLSKITKEDIMDAKKKIEEDDKKQKSDIENDINQISPHNREKLRNLIQHIKNTTSKIEDNKS